MGDENPIRTLGDYSRPSHEGYRNTIELPEGNNVVPLRSDTIRLVQNGCSFHGLRSEDPNQHLKDFLKLVDSLDLDLRTQRRNNFEKELFRNNFMILEDLGSIIDNGLSEVVLGKPFAQTSKLTYDESLGLIRFALKDDEGCVEDAFKGQRI
ncbi:hypothetical protein Tco_0755644 [Tanacetum coccineum]